MCCIANKSVGSKASGEKARKWEQTDREGSMQTVQQNFSQAGRRGQRTVVILYHSYNFRVYHCANL